MLSIIDFIDCPGRVVKLQLLKRNPLKFLMVATQQTFQANTHFSLIPMHPSGCLVLLTMKHFSKSILLITK